jgi:hypothetical protein
MQFGTENWQDDEETIHRILENVTLNGLLPNCLKRILNISKQPLLHKTPVAQSKENCVERRVQTR